MLKKYWYEVQFWLTGTRPYLWAMKHFFPYIRFSLYYALPENEKHLQWGALERKGYQVLQPGDILLTIDRQKFSSKVIGGATAALNEEKPYFVPSHAAICVAKGKELPFEVAEMTHLDYTESTWEDLTRQATRVVIARCKDWDEKYIRNSVIPTALSFKGCKYDDRFQMGADTLACSELVYFADPERRLQVDLSPLIGNRPYITPVGLILGKNVEVVWDSNREV